MATQCLPLYRYTPGGEQHQQHHRVGPTAVPGALRGRWHQVTQDVFAYVYAMLHDPPYRDSGTKLICGGSFHRLYFQEDFAWWTQQGRELLDLHIGFEKAESWPLERARQGRRNADCGPSCAPTRTAAPSRWTSRLSLAGVPTEAWEYRLGQPFGTSSGFWTSTKKSKIK